MDGRACGSPRPSGTEPKIKYYLFAAQLPEPGKHFTPSEVASVRSAVQTSLANLWQALSANANSRLQ